MTPYDPFPLSGDSQEQAARRLEDLGEAGPRADRVRICGTGQWPCGDRTACPRCAALADGWHRQTSGRVARTLRRMRNCHEVTLKLPVDDLEAGFALAVSKFAALRERSVWKQVTGYVRVIHPGRKHNGSWDLHDLLWDLPR